MNALILTTLMTTSFGVIAQSNENIPTQIIFTDYENKWCRDVSFILTNSLESAYYSETFEQEVTILKQAIKRTLEIANPKFSYYFGSSLKLALAVESKLSNSKDKALTLRRNIENALSDLNYIDSRISNRYEQDHEDYVINILARGLDEAMRSKTDQIELQILDMTATAAVEILSESDYRRSQSNACAVRYLKELMSSNDVIYKRNLMDSAQNSLRNRYMCF